VGFVFFSFFCFFFFFFLVGLGGFCQSFFHFQKYELGNCFFSTNGEW
jgi:hypothetical protein